MCHHFRIEIVLVLMTKMALLIWESILQGRANIDLDLEFFVQGWHFDFQGSWTRSSVSIDPEIVCANIKRCLIPKFQQKVSKK